MVAHLDALRDANLAILSRIAAREEQLALRERAITDELEAIENERRTLDADKETIKRAEAIQERIFGPMQMGSGAPFRATATMKADGGQTRARIGAKRYAMWTTLRSLGPITAEGIAERTGLSLQRIRDQMKSDQPLYVTADASGTGWPDRPGLTLTAEGSDLLGRFENYRRSQGKPLPSLGDGGDASDDDEAGAEADEAEAEAQKDEAAGTNPEERMPTASITGADGASDQPRTHG